MDPKVYGTWKQGPDSSWSMTDADGTLLRVSPVFNGRYSVWALAWTEASEGRLRIGSKLQTTAHAAMDHANATVVLPRRKTPIAEAAE